MKLLDIWQACASSESKPVSAWASLVLLKKPPRVAYRLLKYGAKLSAEYEVIEKQRRALLYEAAGVDEGQPVTLESGTPEFDQFFRGFNAFLIGDSDLDPVGLSMDALIDALDSEKGNVLSEQELALLEPFFQESKKE